jgi:saccharopine dehydrogenase (NAD+, L-lysine-forming)
MTGIEPVMYDGHPVVTIKFLKALLPDPASLSAGYTGKTSIGFIVEGMKYGTRRKVMIYNVCDHEACYAEVNAQAVSYTTGVPAVVGAIMMLTKQWHRPGVYNMEEFPAAPFLERLGQLGLPWQVKEL